MPFASLGLYVVFFVARDTPGSSLRSGLTIILVIMFTVALELGVVILSDNDPFVRLISVAVVTFCAGIVMAAGTAPFLGAASGFVYVSVIALWETALPADTLVKLSLWLIATLSVAIGCSVAVEYTFGLRDVADRLTISAAPAMQPSKPSFAFTQRERRPRKSAPPVSVWPGWAPPVRPVCRSFTTPLSSVTSIPAACALARAFASPCWRNWSMSPPLSLPTIPRSTIPLCASAAGALRTAAMNS
jgi:hypothetical protein